MNRKYLLIFSVLIIAALALTACPAAAPADGGDAAAPAAEEAAPAEAEATEVPAEEPAAAESSIDTSVYGEMVAVPGGFLEQAMNGDFSGTVVTVDGPFVDTDQVLFEQSMLPFEEATGIDIQYIGSKEFEGSISVRVDAGTAPDIADFPQPGLLANFASGGHIVDVNSFIPLDYLQSAYNQSWLDMGTVEGADGPIMGGVWSRFFGKSIVWYPVDDFEAAGYEIPTNWEEMMALTQMIADDGDAPWCIGIESGAATGWPATDWTEEMMLRTTSLENYDAWVAGELPFDSPEVRKAIETWGEIWFNSDYVFGGTEGIVSTNFGDSPAPMFEDPPRCWFHKQGNFITSFFPADAVAGQDYSFFYLPGVDPEYGKPWLVSGDLFAMFNDRPEVRATMEYLTLPMSLAAYLETGGGLSTHLKATPEMYGDEIGRGLAALVAEATSFRFDGSDLMPGEVGAGSFWTGMTSYVSGSADLDTVLSEIDASWPTE